MKEQAGVTYDLVEGKCERCGEMEEYWFDISSFFGDMEMLMQFREKTEPLYNRALSEMKEEKWAAAAGDLDEVLAQEPNFGTACLRRAECALKGMDATKAREHAARARVLLPRSADVWALCGSLAAAASMTGKPELGKEAETLLAISAFLAQRASLKEVAPLKRDDAATAARVEAFRMGSQAIVFGEATVEEVAICSDPAFRVTLKSADAGAKTLVVNLECSSGKPLGSEEGK